MYYVRPNFQNPNALPAYETVVLNDIDPKGISSPEDDHAGGIRDDGDLGPADPQPLYGRRDQRLLHGLRDFRAEQVALLSIRPPALPGGPDPHSFRRVIRRDCRRERIRIHFRPPNAKRPRRKWAEAFGF